MFQDLVEAGIFYVALFEDSRTRKFDRSFFHKYENLLPKLFPNLADYQEIIRIRDVSSKNLMLFSDILNEHTVCGYYKKS